MHSLASEYQCVSGDPLSTVPTNDPVVLASPPLPWLDYAYVACNYWCVTVYYAIIGAATNKGAARVVAWGKPGQPSSKRTKADGRIHNGERRTLCYLYYRTFNALTNYSPTQSVCIEGIG
eukprot:scaffold102758_cov64-Attheya_sp.AAC.2